MKIVGYRGSSLLCAAAVVGIFAAGPVAPARASARGQYDGAYHGVYTGSFAGSTANGSVAFSVTGGAMTVTDPGHGAGTVDASGAATFSGSLGVAKIDCKFVGVFKSPVGKQHAIHATGSWTCAGMGQTGTGTWSADRQ